MNIPKQETGEFVAISFAELMAWYKYGELRILADRFVSIPLDPSSGTPDDPARKKMLLSLSPQIDHEYEQSIVIVRMRRDSERQPSRPAVGATGNDGTAGSGGNGVPSNGGGILEQQVSRLWNFRPSGSWRSLLSAVRRLYALTVRRRENISKPRDNKKDREILREPIRSIDQVIPLTDTSRKLLEIRIKDLGIRLEEPVFEDDWNKFLHEEIFRSAIKGGSELVDLVTEENGAFDPENKLTDEIATALWFKDFRPGETPLPEAGAVVHSFIYVRPSIREDGQLVRRQGNDLDYLTDLGRLVKYSLSNSNDQTPSLKDLSNLLAEMKEQPSMLAEILARPDVQKCLGSIKSAAPLEFAVQPASIVTFFKWLEIFRNQDYIDVSDLRTHAEGHRDAGLQEVCYEALFLLGCFKGRETIAPHAYIAQRDGLEKYSSAEKKPIENDPPAGSPGADAGEKKDPEEKTSGPSSDAAEAGENPKGPDPLEANGGENTGPSSYPEAVEDSPGPAVNGEITSEASTINAGEKRLNEITGKPAENKKSVKEQSEEQQQKDLFSHSDSPLDKTEPPAEKDK